MREIILEAIEECRTYTGEYNFQPAEEVKAKKLENAIKSYAYDCKKEDIVAIWDITLFGSAKAGMIFSTKGLYNDYCKAIGCIPFEGFAGCKIDNARENADIFYNDGTVIRAKFGFEDYLNTQLIIFTRIKKKELQKKLEALEKQMKPVEEEYKAETARVEALGGQDALDTKELLAYRKLLLQWRELNLQKKTLLEGQQAALETHIELCERVMEKKEQK